MQSVSNRMILSLWHTHSIALLFGLMAHELMIPPVSGHDKSLIQTARVAPSGPHVSTLLRHDATAPLISIHWLCCKTVKTPKGVVSSSVYLVKRSCSLVVKYPNGTSKN